MSPCKTCGQEVRLRVIKMSVNRKRGVAQWLELKDGGKCPCLEDWAWSVFKPYSKPTVGSQKVEQWNSENQTPPPNK